MGFYSRRTGCWSVKHNLGGNEGADHRKEAGKGLLLQGTGKACSPGLINQILLPKSHTSP